MKNLFLTLSILSSAYLSANTIRPFDAFNAALQLCKTEIVQIVALSGTFESGTTFRNGLSHLLVFGSEDSPETDITLSIEESEDPKTLPKCTVEGIELVKQASVSAKEQESFVAKAKEKTEEIIQTTLSDIKDTYQAVEGKISAEAKRLPSNSKKTEERLKAEAKRSAEKTKAEAKRLESKAKKLRDKVFGS